MLISLALIFLVGSILSFLMKRIGLPGLFGMLITGMILGPFALNLLDDKILSISSELRRIALIIILARAGFTLDIKDLKKVGRPAILLCFVPASFEILGMAIIAPLLLKVDLIDALIMGAVIAAVSPAVVVPKMIHLIKNGYGKKHSTPQMIMAGASVDDIFVIVLFTSFIAIAQGSSVNFKNFINIPISIIIGVILGYAVGIIYGKFLKKFRMDKTLMILITLSISFLLAETENVQHIIPISGLLSVMSLGIGVSRDNLEAAENISDKLRSLWVAAEILLFVLVGAAVNISFAIKMGPLALLTIIICLIFRMAGVYFSVFGTKLSKRERIFSMLSYTPKATVQAAIGSVPLSLGLKSGPAVLTVAVLAILFTAPFGAFMIEKFKYLIKES